MTAGVDAGDVGPDADVHASASAGDADDRRARTDGGFAAWYAEVADGLTRRVGAAVGDPMLGREAAAEAFARAYERWDRVADMPSPEGWVFRVAVNVGRRSWRQRGLEARALARIVSPELGDDADATMTHDDLHRVVRRLPQRQRTALRLRYWDDLTEPQIAQRMDVAPGTVSALLSAARTRMREALHDDRSRGGTR